jgi:hypothetical protein
MEEMINAYKILSAVYEGNSPLRGPRHKFEVI